MLTLKDFNLETLTPDQIGQILIDAKKAYYTTSKPIMDDHTYDTLEEILKRLSPHHRLFQKIGHPNFDTGFAKKNHSMPMGSQNKVTSQADLIHYFELKNIPLSTEFVIQPKCDGISLEIIYQHGQFVEAITRGDGQVGDLISQNVVKMKNFVAQISSDFSGSVRHEILVTQTDFQKLNQISSEKYSNPRNAASGLSQRLDGQFAEFCSLYAVDLYPSTISESEKIIFLKNNGFTPVENFLVNHLNQVESIYQQFLSNRANYPYDTDGLVIKINDYQLSQSLGFKNNRPKFQVAYKFPSQSNTTVIKNITWQVGPLGTITPVAQVEPIEISGAIITYASLANASLIIEKNINQNDIVEISRRGDVIPHVEKVITKVTPGHTTIPQNCPECHHQLVQDHKFLRCPNPNCLPQIIGSLNLFCQTLEILGISQKTIQKLYSEGRIKLPGDFYLLTVNDIKDLENLGEKSAQNIISQIQSKKSLTLKQVFDSAIIPNFSGQRIGQLISAGFNTPQKILDLSLDQLLAIKGFKTTLAQKIIDGLHQRRPWIESILSQVELIASSNSSQLSGLTFCITGTLSIPRNDLIKVIESNGGKITSSVTSQTSYLITNETNSTSTKFTQAQKLGVKIISEAEFNQLINH